MGVKFLQDYTRSWWDGERTDLTSVDVETKSPKQKKKIHQILEAGMMSDIAVQPQRAPGVSMPCRIPWEELGGVAVHEFQLCKELEYLGAHPIPYLFLIYSLFIPSSWNLLICGIKEWFG